MDKICSEKQILNKETKRCVNKNGMIGKKILIKNEKIHLFWLLSMYQAAPDKAKFFIPFFDKLAGTDALRKQIEAGKTEAEIRESWSVGLKKFALIRNKYLLYSE
jgi:uncharacterized protein YbbC (DUF1343 family)